MKTYFIFKKLKKKQMTNMSRLETISLIKKFHFIANISRSKEITKLKKSCIDFFIYYI